MAASPLSSRVLLDAVVLHDILQEGLVHSRVFVAFSVPSLPVKHKLFLDKLEEGPLCERQLQRNE